MGLRYNIIKKVTCPYCGFEESARMPMRFLQRTHLINRTCEEGEGGCGQTFSIRVEPSFKTTALRIESYEQKEPKK